MTEDKDIPHPLWRHRDGDRYIPIACTAWMNESGHGFNYTVLEQASDHVGLAIRLGMRAQGTDDFNIGVLRKDKLVALLWMDEVTDDDPAVLARVAEQINVEAAS
jgi:hypothetical protein